MKRIWRFGQLKIVSVCLVVFLMSFVTAFANPADADMRYSGVLRVGYVLPVGSEDDMIRAHQYYTAYFDELSKYMKMGYKLMPMTVEESLPALFGDQIDVIIPMEYNPVQEGKLLVYSKYDNYYDTMALFMRDGETRYKSDDLNTIDGARVGLYTNRTANQKFFSFVAANGLFVQYEYFSDQDAVVKALTDGKIDLIVDSATNAMELEKLLVSFGIFPTRIAATVKNARVIDELDKAIEKMRSENPDFETSMQRDLYLSTRPEVTNFTPIETSFINAARPLKVIFFGEYRPYVIYDEDTDKVTGIYPDILGLISEASGLTFDLQHVKTYKEATQKMLNGEGDLMINTYGDVSETKSCYYTNTVFEQRCSIVTRRESESKTLSGKRAVMVAGSSSTRRFIEQDLMNWDISYKDSISELLDSVESGYADVAVVDTLRLQMDDRMLANHPGLMSSPTKMIRIPVCLTVSSGQPELLRSILNKAILRIERQKKDAVMLRHTVAVEPKLSLSYLMYHYPVWTAAAAGVVLMLVAIIVFSGYHNRQMHKKNEELRATLNELSSANEARDAYKTKSEKDALTGVFNKGTIEHIVTTGIKNIKEGNAPDAFFIIDLDHFKEANDTRGHQYGDEILKKFATSLCGIVRKNDVVGRFGGDEFILYLKNIPEERVREIAEHVVTAAHELDTTQRPRLSASMGVTLIHSSTELYDTVFRHADYSLYSVKQNGRDGYAIYQGKAQKDA